MSTSQPQTSAYTSSSSDTPRSPDTLPPAALELASKLFNLAREGDTPLLSQYLSAGIPVNLTNHEGNTLLILAAYAGHTETVKMLVEKGVDLERLNERGQSAMAGAVFKGWDGEGGVVEVLWEAGAGCDVGRPSARDCAVMFNRESWVGRFEEEADENGRRRISRSEGQEVS